MLAKSKLNSIETLIYQALIDMEISHEEFVIILKEKDKYGKMKDNLRKMKTKNIKLWDSVLWNERFKWKTIEYFMSSKKQIFLCMYKCTHLALVHGEKIMYKQ